MAATLTPQQRRQYLDTIAALIDAGHTRREIAADLGVTISSVYRYLKHDPDLWERWVAIPKEPKPRGRWTDLDDIRHLASCGLNVLAIAHRLGIQPESVKRRLHRLGEWDLLDRIRTDDHWREQARRHRERTAA